MLRRIFRSLIALATIIVAYQAYVLLAVPLIEPPLAHYQGPRSTDTDLEAGAHVASKYQKLLANYFPPTHWSQVEPPKVLGNWPALLVVDSFTRRDDGWITIHKFALLLFPTRPQEGQPPPTDALVLEAPEGAELQFDENFRPDRFQIGQIVQGKFPGPITIHSEMHEPGPADDLVIETSELAMNSKLLYTMKPVRFRLGTNVGSGRELEIRFQKDEPAASRKMGVSSLEIRRDVQLRIDLKTDRLLPGGISADSRATPGMTEAERANEQPRPPVDITCTGPFQFDFLRYVASFDQNVQVRQLDPSGPGDRIDAQQLDIHFAPKAPGAAAAAANDASRRQQTELSHLEPTLVVAQGQPVVVASPSRRAEARAQHVQLDLRQRRVTLDGARDTTLVSGLNVLKSPTIEYWHPSSDAGTRVGRFRASGPGSLYYVLDPAKPDEVFQAAWQKSVELGRSNGQPVLVLDGRPKLGVAGMGNMAADQLTIWFRELVGASPSTGGLALPSEGAAGDKSQLIPDRLSAAGQVEVASVNLTARTEQLTATFETLIEPAMESAPDNGPTLSTSTGANQLPAVRVVNQSQLSKQKEAPTSSYHVEADRLQLGVRLRGRAAAPATVECAGNVVLREISLVPTTQEPLEIRGGQLTAVGLDGDAARIKIVGSGSTGAAQYVSNVIDADRIAKSQLAQLAGRGMTFYTAVIEIDQRENRLWSDGPGEATILVTRDLTGGEADAPRPVEIRWQNGMDFDGRVATFRGNIQGRGADDTLRCNQLLARLATPIKFSSTQARVDKSATEVAEIEFQGEIMINHYGRDEQGPTSHVILEKLSRLTINQQTGDIRGVGPGIIRSHSFGKQIDALGGLAAGGQRSGDPNRPKPASKLNYARIDFDEGLRGNLYLGEMSFKRRVQAVYGPVDSWEQELDATRPETLSPKCMIITCDELSASEDPVAARTMSNVSQQKAKRMGPVQVVALGNVQIEGQSTAGGQFVASGAKASYVEAKQLIQLEGDGRASASVRTQSQPHPFRGQNISYSLDTGLPSVGNFQGFEITIPDNPQASPATSSQRQPAPRRR